MTEFVLFVMVILTAVSLLVVSPRKAHKRALRALRECPDTEPLTTYGRGEDIVKADQTVQSG